MSTARSEPTPTQFRASRAALDWSLTRAARQAGLSVSSVLRCERERGDRPPAPTRHALRDCYELAGICFLQGGGEGIEIKRTHTVHFAL